MQTVKVKIKKLSTGGGPKPLYQQDKLAGLDAYAIPMQYKLKDDEETINNSEEIVDEDEANVELEKGEVVSRGLITPSESSDFPQLTKVGGKKHSQGGTPASLDGGDFVFSEYLKMSEAEIKALGETGKDKSYASIPSKYVKPFNKAVHKLNTSKDKLDKETAALSIEGIKNKLMKVAMLQESGKGFPDETGFEAKTGGLYKMQVGGKKRYKDKDYNIVPARPMNENLSLFENTDEGNYYSGMNSSGNPIKINKVGKLPSFDQLNKNDPNYKSFWNAWGKAPEDLQRKAWDTWSKTNQRPVYNEENYFVPKEERLNPMQGFQFRSPSNPSNPSSLITRTSSNPEVKSPNPEEETKVDDPLNIYKKNFKDTGFGTMEMVDMLSPFTQPINRYAPIKKRVEAQQSNFRPVDFEAQRQAVKGQVNTAQVQNNLISPSSSISSARNAQLMGQSLDVLNQSFMQEFNTNQMGYQNTEVQNAQMRQQVNQVNAGLADDYDTKYAQMNENFDARKSQRYRQFLQKWYSADKNRSMRNLMNYMMTDYEVGPNNEINTVNQSSGQRMARITGSPSTGESGNLYQMAEESLRKLGFTDITPEDIKKEALRMRGQNLNINNQRSFEMLPNMLMQYIMNQNTRNIQGLGQGASDYE
jgi:hypothetical protein